MTSKKRIIANWKMHPASLSEAKKLFLAVKGQAAKLRQVETVICPPVVYLAELSKLYSGHRVSFGAQDVFYETRGAYTGEISPAQLKSVGAQYVLVGHSERRHLGESDEVVEQKLNSALKGGLHAVLCIGEEERDQNGAYLGALERQIESALKRISPALLKNLSIAYEPVWAIGGDSALSPRDMHEMVIFIRKVLTQRYSKKTALMVPVFYGGSVDTGNTQAFLTEGEVDGLLVGRASTNPDTFSAILAAANTVGA